jgi:phytoene dehydrogenase-like protein
VPDPVPAADQASAPAGGRYDVAIIGCGMAGLAAGIRAAMFGKRTVILERHYAPGGLNSFYALDRRDYDVGLHAVTNYTPPGARSGPLVRILRQLRLDRDQLDLCPQRRSRVAFLGCGELEFTNDAAVLEASVARQFPRSVDRYRALVKAVSAWEENAADRGEDSARGRLEDLLGEPLLQEMLLCPLCYYGSPVANDMRWWEFAVLFRSIFLEGFARPQEGVRRILRTLVRAYKDAGGERRMRCGVKSIVTDGARVHHLVLDSGDELAADRVISTVGWPETVALCGGAPRPDARVGALSFVEGITVLRSEPATWGWDDTIVFFNDGPQFHYASPPAEELVDPRSGVIAVPNNYAFGEGRSLPEGVFRVTCLASHAGWASLPEDAYRAAKAAWFPRMVESALRFGPPVDRAALQADTVATDMFTPRTIERYTWRRGGAVYGSPDKRRDGTTPWNNLFVAGTDQGYLGIVGSLVSGIAAANLHVLRGG